MEHEQLLHRWPFHSFLLGLSISGVDIPESGEITSSKDLKTCTFQIQELVLGSLNTAIAGKLLGSVNILRDSYTGIGQAGTVWSS